VEWGDILFVGNKCAIRRKHARRMQMRYKYLIAIIIGLMLAALMGTVVLADDQISTKLTMKLKQAVYLGLAENGKKAMDMEIEQSGPLGSLTPTDECYELDDDRGNATYAYRSVLDIVAGNMGKGVDFNKDSDIEKLLDDFNALDETSRIVYGIWGDDTPEGKVKQLLLKGKTLKEAKDSVDPQKAYWSK
jgi:hypothetical protein